MRPFRINVVPTTDIERRAWERAGVFVRERPMPGGFGRGARHPDDIALMRHFWPGAEYAEIDRHRTLKMACGVRVLTVGGARYTALRHDGDHPVTCRRCRGSKAFNEAAGAAA